MIARVVGLTWYTGKGEPGVPVNEMNLIKDVGIEGDYHRGSEKQVSLLPAEARRWMRAQTRSGLCFGRFRENMLIEGHIDGLPLEELDCGILLSVGSAALKIGVRDKRCFDECGLFTSGMPCRLSSCVCFTTVAQSGTVRIGDAVSIRQGLLT